MDDRSHSSVSLSVAREGSGWTGAQAGGLDKQRDVRRELLTWVFLTSASDWKVTSPLSISVLICNEALMRLPPGSLPSFQTRGEWSTVHGPVKA